MKQMPNSNPNAQITSVCPTCHNTMLGAGAVSSDDASNEQSLELFAPINCPQNLKSFLEIRENSGELSRTMNKEKIEKILDEAQISIDKIRDNMSNSNYSQDIIELYKSPILILNAWIPSNSFHETIFHV